MVFPDGASGKSAQEVFADVSGGVVVVLALDAGGAQIAQGSGVVVGGNEVATNCHVVAGAADIAVRQAADARGRETWRMEARLVARNEARDLCLLSVAELADPPAAPPVRLGSARALSVGEEVYAVGAPQGLTLSLSRGIVSQLRGDHGKRTAPIVQTDAAVSPGSSGGGLFNGEGELVGITTFKHAGAASEGLSFATPAEWVRELVAPVRERRERRECFAAPTADCLFTAAVRETEKIDLPLRVDVLCDIASAQAEAGDKAGARATVSKALQTAQKIDDAHLHTAALSNIAAMQAEAEDIAGALQTAGKIDDAYNRPRALSTIAAAQAEAGDIAGALQTAGKIDDAYNRPWALSTIAAAQAETGDKAGARATLAEALQTARKIGKAYNRAWALSTIAAAQAETGDKAGARVTLAEALQTAGKIGKAYNRPRALSTIAAAQAEAGDIAGALQTAGKIDNASDRAWALSAIATAQAEAGDKAGASATAAEALQIAEKIGGLIAPSRALSAIAAAQAVAGDKAVVRAIVAIAENIAENIAAAPVIAPFHTATFIDIAAMQAEAGDIAGALQTAGKIDNAGGRAQALSAIAAAQAEAGDKAGARATLAEALQKIDSATARALSAIAAALAKTE